MNKSKDFECELCHKKINDDLLITLPCGFIQCFEHLGKDDPFKCHFCPSHMIQKSDCFDMHKNRLRINQMKIKDKIEDLKDRKLFLSNIQRDPKGALGDTFSIALKSIDTRRDFLIEEFNKQVNEIHSDLVKKVKEKEKNCVNELKTLLKDWDLNRIVIDKDQNNNIIIEYKESNFLNRAQDKELVPIGENNLRNKHNEVKYKLNEFKNFKFETPNNSILVPELFGDITCPIHKQPKRYEKIEFLRTYSGHENDVFLIRKINDETFASCSSESIKIWSKLTARCLKTFKDTCEFVSIYVHDDDLICFLVDGNVVIKSIAHGLDKKAIKTAYKPSFYVECVEVVNEKEYFSGHSDGSIIHWQNFVNVKKFLGHVGSQSGNILSLKYIERDKVLFSSSRDNTIRIFNVETGEQMRKFEFPGVKCIGLFGNNTFIFSSITELKAWDMWKGESFVTLTQHQKLITDMAIVHKSGIFTCAIDGTVHLWLSSMGEKQEIAFKVDGAKFTAILYVDKDEILLGDSKSVKLWNLNFKP